MHLKVANEFVNFECSRECTDKLSLSVAMPLHDEDCSHWQNLQPNFQEIASLTLFSIVTLSLTL